jgi:hypothetical protein
MPDTPITKLYRARIIVHRQLSKAEAMVAERHKKLMAIEAKIMALDRQLWLPPPKRRANPYFKPGELPRIGMKLLREADGPVSVRYLAIRALTIKGCPHPTPGIMKQTRITLSQAMTAWNKRGLVVKLGRWKETRHVLRSLSVSRTA